VWDKPYEISVYQKSKSVWIAVGEYMGERLETKGSSKSAAVEHGASESPRIEDGETRGVVDLPADMIEQLRVDLSV
jgi:hypothetical protein